MTAPPPDKDAAPAPAAAAASSWGSWLGSTTTSVLTAATSLAAEASAIVAPPPPPDAAQPAASVQPPPTESADDPLDRVLDIGSSLVEQGADAIGSVVGTTAGALEALDLKQLGAGAFRLFGGEVPSSPRDAAAPMEDLASDEPAPAPAPAQQEDQPQQDEPGEDEPPKKPMAALEKLGDESSAKAQRTLLGLEPPTRKVLQAAIDKLDDILTIDDEEEDDDLEPVEIDFCPSAQAIALAADEDVKTVNEESDVDEVQHRALSTLDKLANAWILELWTRAQSEHPSNPDRIVESANEIRAQTIQISRAISAVAKAYADELSVASPTTGQKIATTLFLEAGTAAENVHDALQRLAGVYRLWIVEGAG